MSAARRVVVLRNQVAEVQKLAEAVTEFATKNGLPEAITNAVQLVLEEMAVNVIVHGYRDGREHQFEVRLNLADGWLTAELDDDAPAFNPLEAPRPDIDQPVEDRPIGGMGIDLTRRATDELAYRRTDGHNVLTMKWRTMKA